MLSQGWPIPCRRYDVATGIERTSNLAMVFDILFGIAVLLTVAYVCEWWIARQEARKQRR